MPAYGIAEAKAKFSELIDRAARGEEVLITRHGKPVVQWSRPSDRKAVRRVSVEELRAALANQPKQSLSTAEIIRQMRDEGL